MVKNYKTIEDEFLGVGVNKFAGIEKNKKSAIIVGASSGIGEQLAKKLLKMNYNVINISRGECQVDRVINLSCDVTDEECFKNAFEEISRNCPYLSLLIYSAGFSMAAPIELAERDDYKYLFDVNYFGVITAVQQIIPYFKKRGGRIILVSSIASVVPIAYDSFYSASKASLDMLARGMYMELKKYRIKVTSVQVGGTATDFTFKRKVYSEDKNIDYAHNVKKAVVALAGEEQGGMSPEKVAEKILKLITLKRPPITVAIGFKNKSFTYMQRVLPEKVSMYLNSKFFNQ